jgi:UDP-3-O-[3-hydroxymyristoyl] glucosamine N-acyltransferase
MTTTLLTAEDIAREVNGRLEGEGSRRVESAAGLEEAGENQISFFHNLKYGEILRNTRAGTVLIPEKLTDYLPPSRTLIRVANPQWAFAQVLSLLSRDWVHHPQGIHSAAVIDPSAKIADSAAVGAGTIVARDAVIGPGTIIYANSYIGERAHIGENCLIYPNVVIREDSEIGARIIVHSGAVLGADGYGFVTHQGRHHKIPQIGRVVIGDDVEIGANVTIDRATIGETRVGSGTKIDNLVHIAHNVQIGKNCLIVAQVGISGSTRIGNSVTLAGQVGIIGHLTIGDGATIAAQSGVINDVKPGEVMFGSPARTHREEMKLQAILGKLPDIYETFRALKKKFLDRR